MAKCPECKAPITNLRRERVLAREGDGPVYVMVYSCVECATAIGVGVDPVNLKNMIVGELAR